MDNLPIILTTAIFLANLLSLHFFGKKACMICNGLRKHIMPFLTGAYAITLFMILIPKVLTFTGFEYYRTWVYVSFATGFFVFLFLEIFIYKKEARPDLPKDLQLVHIGVLCSMGLLGGLMIKNLTKNSLTLAIMVTAGFILLSQTHKYSLHLINKKEVDVAYIFAALAAPLGAIIGLFIHLTTGMLKPLIGFVTGWLLFSIILDIYENKTENSSLIIGVITGCIITYMII